MRYLDQYHGIYFVVSDKTTCFSMISADIRRISLTEPVTGLWSNDPTYARYLISTFEMLWEQSVPAAQRIEELLKEGPPHVSSCDSMKLSSSSPAIRFTLKSLSTLSAPKPTTSKRFMETAHAD